MTMQEEQIREALNQHWKASAAGDTDAEHAIYADDAICDYPQSGERILGRANLQALRSHHPGKPAGFNVKRILGKGDLWITEYTITYQGRPAYTVSIMEFRNGKIVHETQYFADPFEARPGGANGFSGSRNAAFGAGLKVRGNLYHQPVESGRQHRSTVLGVGSSFSDSGQWP
jgi:SnoaL-like protein